MCIRDRFAHSLFRMYTMYAETRGWKYEVLNANETELGGVKDCLLYTSIIWAAMSGRRLLRRQVAFARALSVRWGLSLIHISGHRRADAGRAGDRPSGRTIRRTPAGQRAVHQYDTDRDIHRGRAHREMCIRDSPIGVSNEFAAETATLRFSAGMIYLVLSRKEPPRG